MGISGIFEPLMINHGEEYHKHSHCDGQHTNEELRDLQLLQGEEVLEIVEQWHHKSLEEHKAVNPHQFRFFEAFANKFKFETHILPNISLLCSLIR